MIWIRLFFIFLKSFFKKKITSVEEITKNSIKLSFRVWFNEADLKYLNGSRYMTFMEIGRFDLMLRTGNVKHCLDNKWVSVVAGQQIFYKRPIKRFQKFTLGTRIIYWDDKFLYVEHKFESNKKLMATAYIKVTWLNEKKQIIPVSKLFAKSNLNMPTLSKPEFIDKWLENEKLAYKWSGKN